MREVRCPRSGLGAAVRHIVIDTKNLALFTGGISGWVRPLIGAWLAARPDTRFTFLGPPFDSTEFASFRNWQHHRIAWPHWLPRRLRHPFYDNVLFPQHLKRLHPDVLFSPYHDVRIPSDRRTRSFISVQDLCFDELEGVYPVPYRAYYQHMLRRNIKRAAHIFTCSESSRHSVIHRYGLAPHDVTAVYCGTPPSFDSTRVDDGLVDAIRGRYGGARLILYTAGREYRKNIHRLVKAFALLGRSEGNWRLIITDDLSSEWNRVLARHEPLTTAKIHFVGHLPVTELKAHYAAAHVVVYPSLCEGFGRATIEAMSVGTPFACSDLPVFREVAGDYAFYFDPRDPVAMAATVRAAAEAGRLPTRRDLRFSLPAITSAFTKRMDELVLEAWPTRV